MGSEKPTYEELEARLAEAESFIEALRHEEVDAVIGRKNVYLLRLKQMEKSLRDSERRFRRLTEGNIIGVIVARMEGVIDANDIFLEMLGYTRQELLEGNIDWRAITPPEYEPRDEKALEELREKGSCTPFEKEYWRKDGTRVPILIGASLLSPEPLTWICFVLELTELKAAQQAREQDLSRQASLTDAASQILAQHDIAGLLEVIPDAARKLTGAKMASSGHGYVTGQFLTGSASRAEDIPPCPEGDVFALRKGGVYMEVIDSVSSIRLTDAEMRRHPRWWGLPEDHVPLNGLLGAPLVGADGSPNGMILVSHKDRGEFTGEDETGLKQLAALASLGLQNLEARKTLESRVLERTADLEARTRELEKLNRERKYLAQRLVELLERDRSNTAMALHDHAGQLLTTIKIDLELIEKDVSKSPALPRVKSATRKTVELLNFIRDISRNLRPSSLDHLGLVASARTLIDDMKRETGIDIHFFTRNIPEPLGPHKELTLYRILQEALNNVAKHADADEVYVNLVFRANTILLTVEDNGKGFDHNEIQKLIRSERGPLGLSIMKERALQVDGELRIESEVGRGTVVFAEIPVG